MTRVRITRARLLAIGLGAAVVAAGCGDDATAPGTDSGVRPGTDGGVAPGADAGPAGMFDGSVVPPHPVEGWPTPNEYSWNGSWTPTSFPIDGLLDNEYFDMHVGRDGMPTPILPPGEWDYADADNDLANWRNFYGNHGDFQMLRDMAGNHFGWRMVPNMPDGADFGGAAAYFEGSSGPDIIDLGPGGHMNSYGQGNLANGPDVLVFNTSWSLDFRTGDSRRGGDHDDDLVVAGCSQHPDGAFDITTTTIHTGPGSDWVFIRDLSRAGIDAGNGDGGLTSVLDPLDGHDMVVFRGNTQDFRFSGGAGNDVAVWYVDDNVQTTPYLGPNFFGGGLWDAAVWGDPGTDRLVLAVPTTTTITTTTPTPMGAILVRPTDGVLVDDPPTASDPFAHYCVECGTGPGGRKTVILEYNSASGSVHTGYFFVTAMEELQVGVGPGARVYRIDDVAGALIEDATLTPFVPPSWPDEYCR